MARPRKKDHEKLSKVLPIRCSETDLSDLKARAQKSGLCVSEFVRDMAVNGKIIVNETSTNFEVVQELKRSGNNLNQIAKRFNATGIEPAELRNVLHAHEMLLTKLFKTL